MHKKTLIILASGLFFTYMMLVGIFYYGGNTSSEARRPKLQVNPGCIQGVKSVKVSGNCRVAGVRGYREARFECLGGAKGELHSRSCLAGDKFKEIAESSCGGMSVCTATSTPMPAVTAPEEELSPTPTPESEPDETLTPTPTVFDITPTPCAMPTGPYCEGGTLVESEEPQSPGVCPPRYDCVMP